MTTSTPFIARCVQYLVHYTVTIILLIYLNAGVGSIMWFINIFELQWWLINIYTFMSRNNNIVIEYKKKRI